MSPGRRGVGVLAVNQTTCSMPSFRSRKSAPTHDIATLDMVLPLLENPTISRKWFVQ